MNQEVGYQTSGIGADTSAGGVRLNMIPKEGGNRFSGSFSAALSPRQMAGRQPHDRLKPDIQTSSPQCPVSRWERDRPDHGFHGGEGGPILKNKLWFFVSARYYSVNNFIAQTALKDGGQGVDDQFIKSSWRASRGRSAAIR